MNGVAAVLLAVCVSVLAAMGLAFPLGGLSPLIAAVSLGAGALAGALQFAAGRRREAGLPARKISGWDWAVIVVYTLFSLRAFCWLVFWNGDNIQFISNNNLGDLSLHLTYINNLASGVPFWPENPIFAGEKIHYSLGIDIFNSLLKLAGMDVYRGLVCVGLAACLVTGIALYKWGRGFAIAGFLFNGGLAGFQFFEHFHLDDYQSGLAWKSIPLAMFVTQRGLLYAIPAGLALLWSWRARFFPDLEKKSDRPLPFVTEVLLYSTMPLFHLHTFIFLSFMLGCWMVMTVAPYMWKKPIKWITPGISFTIIGLLRLLRLIAPTLALIIALLLLGSIIIWHAWSEKPKMLIQLLKLVACAFIPATALIALLTGFFKSRSVIHLVGHSPGDTKSWDWTYGGDLQHPFDAWTPHIPRLLQFLATPLGHAANWVGNFGAFPFFVLTLAYALFRKRGEPSSRRAAAFVCPAVLIFIVSCFVMFAPWDWDNTKIMVWCYLAVLPFLWDQMLAKEKLLLRAACCCMLYFSGFVSLLGGIDGTHTGYSIDSQLPSGATYTTTRSELDEVASSVKSLPVTAIFAGYPIYNHPLLLDGRKMVEGYDGHLMSHGIDYGENRARLESLLNGDPGWRDTARKLHARYLFWGKLEEDAYPDSTKPWEDECLEVAEGDFGKIYDLDAPATPQQKAPRP